MKRILFFSFLFLELSSVFAQKPYRSLEECENDTIRYVLYNFQENKERYIGKTMQFVFDEIDMPLMTHIFFPGSTFPMPEEERMLEGLSLSYYCHYKMMRYNKLKKTYYYVSFSFRKPYTRSDQEWKDFQKATALSEDDDAPWGEAHYNFFKDCVIDEVYVTKYN